MTRSLVCRSALSTLAVAAALLLPAGALAAPPQGKTVRTTIHLPAFVQDNLCNADAVILNGDLRIVTQTTPTRDGGFNVTSTSRANNLQGYGLPSGYGYEGDQTEYSDSHYAAPPFPSSFEDSQYTRLVPKGAGPSMYLVVVVRETTTADGRTIPVFDNAYVTCHGPGA
jgi:hypothetical protein